MSDGLFTDTTAERNFRYETTFPQLTLLCGVNYRGDGRGISSCSTTIFTLLSDGLSTDTTAERNFLYEMAFPQLTLLCGVNYRSEGKGY